MHSTATDPAAGDGPDGSSLKPVSSLRARFENMNKAQDAPPLPQPISRPISPAPKPNKLRDFKPIQEPAPSTPSPFFTPAGPQDRSTTPAPRPPASRSPGPSHEAESIVRPTSTRPPPPVKSHTLATKPPAVTIQPPLSPPKGRLANISVVDQSIFLNPDAIAHTESPVASPKPFRIPARPVTPSNGSSAPRSPGLTASQPPSPPPPRRSGELKREREPKIAPPPPAPRNSKLLIPANKPAKSDASPRHTPSAGTPTLPGSPDESASDEQPPQLPSRPRPQNSHPQPVRPLSVVEQFEPPPVHHSVAVKRRDLEEKGQSKAQLTAHTTQEEQRPMIPARPQAVDSIAHPVPLRRTTGQVGSTFVPPRPPRQAVAPSLQTSEATAAPAPTPPKRISSNPTPVQQMLPPPARNQGRSQTIDRTTDRAPAEFRISPGTISSLAKPTLPPAGGHGTASPANGVEQVVAYPDGSTTNRRPPFIKKGCYEIQTKYDPRVFDVCGELVCTSGQLTRLWNISDGELLMSLSHTEGVRATSVAFKPAADPQKEGSKIWIGTNLGEILEVDVETHSITPAKPGGHGKCEVIRMYRHYNEMWTLDEAGNFLVWGPDETHVPNLGHGASHNFKVPRGHTFSMVVGDELWLATGKDIRIYAPTPDSSLPFQVLLRPLTVDGAGEVTAGTQINSQPGKVFLGHADGKVSIHTAKDYTCQSVINVSSWKINTMSGVGRHIWAGYTNGSISIYDIDAAPWALVKEWRAHDNPVLNVKVDAASPFRTDRLQVVSLGADNKVKAWDGLLEDDWVEDQMKSQDDKYCDFDELRALVLTWNAGASTPHSLRYSGNDGTFFQDLLQSSGSPDILVFGFQELVDLEDKAATAKRFLKVKKKEGSDQEKMSHQYRDWRDFLLKTLDDYMPADDLYHLLHTAPMVGLFTCVFVKASLRERIRNLSGVEIKRGMGGVYGNKGAVAVRFQVDDTSLCFVNCHLAAGQTQAAARHNDANAILEADVFPAERDANMRIDSFTGGGDGTLILDHELCVLNGDLNYRIDTMSRDTVVTAVKNKNLVKLLERDQLLVARRRNPGLRLRAFEELPITFAPTYKYDVGTDNYDTSEKKRSPAWCDRLLFRGRGRIQQLDYQRHEIRVSDHRPVSGTFRLWVKKVDPKRRAAVWMESQQSFEDLRQRALAKERLLYLMNTCGFDEATSKRLVKDKAARKVSRSPSRAAGGDVCARRFGLCRARQRRPSFVGDAETLRRCYPTPALGKAGASGASSAGSVMESAASHGSAKERNDERGFCKAPVRDKRRVRSDAVGSCPDATVVRGPTWNASTPSGPNAPPSHSPPIKPGESKTDALTVILDRLRRVEEQCTTLPQTLTDPSTIAARGSATQSPAVPHATLSSGTPKSQTTSPAASFVTADRASHGTPLPSSSSSHGRALDATAILKDAVDLVERHVLQDIASSIITQEIHIPADLAKSWIDGTCVLFYHESMQSHKLTFSVMIAAYWEYTPTQLLNSFVDRHLIEMMPELLVSSHVRIDGAIILIYYSVLYDGCNFRAMTTNPEDIQHAKSIYLCCLRALPGWEREITGTMVDIVAAMSLVWSLPVRFPKSHRLTTTQCRVATEFFDYELAWRMFQHACGYAEDLGLHKIDAGSKESSGNARQWDEDRKGFWDLLHVDLLFRLIFNKQPSLSGRTWRVNLPWLDKHTAPDSDGFSTMNFIVSSRLSLVQLRFFEMLETASEIDKKSLWTKTEGLCQEILDLYEEWGISRWVSESTSTGCLMFVAAAAALTGYTSIIFMLRKITRLDSNSPRPISSDADVPDSPLALQASRHIIYLFGLLAKQYPWTGTMSAVFGAFQGNIAYGYLVKSILSDSDIASRRDDIELLRRVSDCIREIASREKMFVPLTRAMNTLNEEIRRKGG
ncbi:hypothetical protein S7711_04985 [Stachybotrys chartarum IBT 7711]|uniref:Inositol polyphosphate-related phosphatase domain-containing protein n=1 Tax=Stachybotrys chartarum (strain CBS 109288 / IBT 7711) TaxID=1280523 RepID=A0A084ARB9_STACB|nr:hypothetical protein S7711_04985 [Stachybotrys chartarum IBT 7711]